MLSITFSRYFVAGVEGSLCSDAPTNVWFVICGFAVVSVSLFVVAVSFRLLLQQKEVREQPTKSRLCWFAVVWFVLAWLGLAWLGLAWLGLVGEWVSGWLFFGWSVDCSIGSLVGWSWFHGWLFVFGMPVGWWLACLPGCLDDCMFVDVFVWPLPCLLHGFGRLLKKRKGRSCRQQQQQQQCIPRITYFGYCGGFFSILAFFPFAHSSPPFFLSLPPPPSHSLASYPFSLVSPLDRRVSTGWYSKKTSRNP